ncbi:MAG: sodium:proton exchanger [Planctomycetes bacterium]|nr:sodium:proton exchanger [Planctomycetota bacterium]
MTWLVFVGLGVVVIAASVLLGWSVDLLAQRTGIGRVWMGAFVLAAATSMPELLTDLTAVQIGAGDLAAGDLFGSNLANMLILALASLSFPARNALRLAAPENAGVGALAIGLTALAGAALLVRPTPSSWPVGIESVAIALLYVVASPMLARRAGEGVEATAPRRLARPLVGVLISALAILLSAPAFAQAAERLAEETGLGRTAVGTVLLGFATSLPELASTVTALRLNAVDLAVGNLLGSNAFNMLIFPVLDLADGGGPLFNALDPRHAQTAFLAVVAMASALFLLVLRRGESWVVVVVYAIAVWVVLR